MTIIIFVFLGAIVFGLNLFILITRFKQTEDKLKKQLQDASEELLQTQNKLRNLEEPVTKAGGEPVLGFSHLSAATIILNGIGTVKLVNPAAEKIINIPAADVLGKTYKQALKLRADNYNDPYETVEKALRGEPSTFPGSTYLLTQATNTPISGRCLPLVIEGKTIGVCILLDLKPSASAQTGATEAVEAKSEVYSFVAHELRNCLSVIKSSLDLVLGEWSKIEEQKKTEVLQTALDQTTQMGDLINNFLGLTKIDQGRTVADNKPFDMSTLVGEVVDANDAFAKSKNLYFNFEKNNTPAKARGDMGKSREIINNLVSNAIKYTFQGGVTINLQKENSHIAVIVKDTGMGISAENQSLLFKKFQQIGVSRQMPSAKSSGLGLYLSKRLAQLTGGDLELVSSEPTKGSVFKFFLPSAA